MKLIDRVGWSVASRKEEPQLRICLSRRPDLLPANLLPWLWLSPGRPPEGAATQAVLNGAYDVIDLTEPGAFARLERRLNEWSTRESAPSLDPRIVSHSAAARRTFAHLLGAARTSMPVLLTGETGTGKELAARLIHERSPRGKGPFVPINCAAIPNELMEAELFGYAKGAFSGATRGFDGQLVAASGGTVFLDEIDDTPLFTQIKLLRVLEDRVVNRLGESAPRKVDFRIIAATNRDLKALIAKGSFGQDFYERLAIVSIGLSPLRERLEDLPALVEHFIERFYREEPQAEASLARVKTLSPEALEALQHYPWPGNIRELRNAIFESLVYKRRGTELLLSDLPRRLLRSTASPAQAPLIDPLALAERMERQQLNLRWEIEELERAALKLSLERSGGNASRAARLLGEVGRGQASDPGGTVRAMQRRLSAKR
jgi:two-component system NtrC family response regulator